MRRAVSPSSTAFEEGLLSHLQPAYTPRVSIELVARSYEALAAELETVRARFPFVETVNIPDLTRFALRSTHACEAAQRCIRRAIPHLRAVGTNLKDLTPLLTFLDEAELHEVLVVSGDLPADMRQPIYPTTSVQLVRAIKAALPHVAVYAALDPYRQSLVKERDYALEKLEAGASGLFTQPFFDLRLMQVYRELLPDVNLYWGVTTVTTQRSLGYWQNRNHAVFPADFEPTLAWSRGFAARALEFAKETRSNLYFMPIKSRLEDFLEGILTPERLGLSGDAHAVVSEAV
jgi:methylenetetrahydrofolate reductase (NADPH)